MKSSTNPQTRQFIIYVLIVLVTLGILWFVSTLRDFIGLFLVACFFALLLSPFVARLQKWKFPHILAIFTTFAGVLIIVSLVISSIIPVALGLVEDSKSYIVRSVTALEIEAKAGFPILDRLPLNLDSLIRKQINNTGLPRFLTEDNRSQLLMDNLTKNIDGLKNFLGAGASQVSTIGLSFATGLTSAITTFGLFLLLTFFIILERKAFLRWFLTILPSHLGHYFRSREIAINDAIHAWLKGQLILAAGMFAINFIGLFIAQLLGLPVQHIFSLALIAGAMEFVPYIGPLIAFFPALLMVLVSPDVSIWAVVGVSALYILFQQIEGNVMVPLVMSRTLSLSSLYILVVTLIGAILGGPLGVLLAIPLASIINIFYHDWMHYRRSSPKP